jgi:hypothetical protein
VPSHRQAAQKLAHFPRTESDGMTLPVKKDKSADPVDVGLLGPVRVVQRADGISDLVEESDTASPPRK